MPAIVSAALLLVDALAGRRRAGASLVALVIYLVLMIVFLGVGWRWHHRHLLPGAARPSLWYQFTHLGVPPRLRLVAPLGVVFFGAYAVLLAVRVVDSATSHDWSGLTSAVVFMLLWIVLFYRCALACWRLLAGRRRSA